MTWRLKQQARQRLSREVVLVDAGYRRPAGIRACLAYPNTYAVGMSNLGFQTVHRVMNRIPGLSCERAFLPNVEDIAELRRARSPLFSLETQTSLAEFDLLGLSVSYEMDYPNVPRMLDLAGIPPLARDRTERHPIVIAGGPCITYNPEPLADFLDACVIGEGEVVLPGLAVLFQQTSMARGVSRAELLLALAEVPGVYVPSLYTPETATDGTFEGLSVRPGAPPAVARQWVANLDDHPCASFILSPEAEFGDMFTVEVIRGCGRACRFCIAGYITRPPRVRSRAAILDLVGAALPFRRKVGLVGPSLSDYPDLGGLVDEIAGLGAEVSASSLRADTLMSTPVAALAASGETSITIAPEGGSQRLRHAVNKAITDEEIYAAVAHAAAAGIERVKLYFMVGLPTETDEDVDAIAEMCRRIAQVRGIRRVLASVNPFVPKPGTPLQWCGMAAQGVLATRLRRLRSRLRGVSRVALSGEGPREATIQAALSRGDRRLSGVLLAVARGASWGAAFREQGTAPEVYAQREIPPDAPLPWDVVDLGLKRRVLRYELEATLHAHERLRGGLTAPCRVGLCRRCGVCPPGYGAGTP